MRLQVDHANRSAGGGERRDDLTADEAGPTGDKQPPTAEPGKRCLGAAHDRPGPQAV
jgi:hypothetical protein